VDRALTSPHVDRLAVRLAKLAFPSIDVRFNTAALSRAEEIHRAFGAIDRVGGRGIGREPSLLQPGGGVQRKPATDSAHSCGLGTAHSRVKERPTPDLEQN
jgi:hypothetical protein